MTKAEARSYVLAQRKLLNLQEKSNKAFCTFKELDILKDFTDIGIYYPLKGELDLLRLIEEYPDKRFYLPITKERLQFVLYTKGMEVYEGAFHVKEPRGIPVNLDQLGAICIPCLAISKNQKRLGYGKGFYDKALKNYSGLKIGVCIEEFTGMDICMQDFDLIMDRIIKG